MKVSTFQSLGKHIQLQFQNLTTSISQDPNREGKIEHFHENIDAEQERFQLWAANIGILATGDRSLDYRVQDSPNIKSYTEELLHEFVDDLNDLSSLLNLKPSNIDVVYLGESESIQKGNEQDGENEVSSTSDRRDAEHAGENDSSEDDSNEIRHSMESVTLESSSEAIESMIGDISDIIDRLYRLASKLRSSSNRVPPSARNFYREPLIEAEGEEIYLTKSERQAAQKQCEMFHQHRIEELVRQSMRDDKGDQFPKEDKTPTLSARTTAVIRRIAKANAHRQQQFAFWRSRELDRRGILEYKVNEPAKSHVASSEVPPPTWKILNEPNLAGDEAGSLSSQTTSLLSQTAYDSSGWKVIWPKFPEELRDKKYFICPYCYVTCPANYSRERHWKAHMLQDLKPYTCMVEHCDEGDDNLLYTREEWIVHEQVYHRMEYTCRYHVEQTFPSKEAFSQHVTHLHPGEEEGLLGVSNMDARMASHPRYGCPLCPDKPKTWQEMDKHLAYHLEYLAIPTIPSATGLEKEDANIDSLELEGDENSSMKPLDDDEFKSLPIPTAHDQNEPIQSNDDGSGSQSLDNPSMGALSDLLENVNLDEAPSEAPSEVQNTYIEDDQTDKSARGPRTGGIYVWYCCSCSQGPLNYPVDQRCPFCNNWCCSRCVVEVIKT